MSIRIHTRHFLSRGIVEMTSVAKETKNEDLGYNLSNSARVHTLM